MATNDDNNSQVQDISSVSSVPAKTKNPRRVAHAGQGNHCPQEVKDAVLERIRSGMGVRDSMLESGYHPAELYDWVREDPEYAKRFAIAKKALAHFYAQESIDLLDKGSADDVVDAKRASAHVNLLGARSKARQWLASKWLPDEYGERIEHRGTVTNAVVLLPPLDPLPLQATAKTIGPDSQGPIVDAEVVETLRDPSAPEVSDGD